MTTRVILPVLAVFALLAGAPATASAHLSSHTAGATATNVQARFGSRFRPSYSRPRFGSRSVRRPGYRYRSPSFRPHFGRSLLHGVLRAIGIAYLAHLIFGWGAGGGSPFGLLILIALVLFVLGRRRRRSPMAW